MLITITLSLLIPIFIAIITLLQTNTAVIRWLNILGSILTSAVLLTIIYQVSITGAIHIGMFYVDQLSSILLLVVAALNVTAILFSVSYMERELQHGAISCKMLPRYYGLLNGFVFTMIGVLVVENLGLMWVAVEATTLASTLLVAFYFNHSALEAAWKYVMVCTVGICLALLGTIILYYAQVNAAGPGVQALSWLSLRSMGETLDPAMAKLAFVFLFIGYGTKAGLAPMHTWLPDAHSQAPSPVSGMLSGALLSCAMYALLRNMLVLQASIGVELPHYLFLGFGFVSIAIAVPFILVQRDLKRLLAYSSVEHMGIISVGFGIGTPLAVYGALLHIINHAIAKSTLFYLAGVITQEYRTKHMMRIRGLVHTMPVVGTLFMMAILTITGTPPFNIFISKFMIVWAAFSNQQGLLGSIILILLTGIFSGMMYYALRMVFGSVRANVCPEPPGRYAMVALLLSMLVMVTMGFYIPSQLSNLLLQAAAIVVGG